MKRYPIYGILFAVLLSTGWCESPDRPERKPLPRRGPPSVEKYFEQLEQQNPEEVQSLRELQQTDPQAFRRELRRRVHQRKNQNPHSHPSRERRASIEDYVAMLQDASTPEEREQALTRIQTSIAKRVDRGFEMREQAIQNLRKKLASLEERHLQDKQNREEIIARHLQRIEAAAQAESSEAKPPSPARPMSDL